MNAEKLHNNMDPNLAGEQNPEELEKFQEKVSKDLADKTKLAMEVDGKGDAKPKRVWSDKQNLSFVDRKSDDQYEDLLDRANKGDKVAQRRLARYQEARTNTDEKQQFSEADLKFYSSAEGQDQLEKMVIDAKNTTPTSEAEKKEIAEIMELKAAVDNYIELHKEELAENEPAQEEQKLDTELNDLSDEKYEELLDKASRGEDIEIDGKMVNAQAKLAELQGAHAEAAKDAAVEASMDKLDNDVLGPEGVTDLIDNFDADHKDNKEYGSFDEFASEPVDGEFNNIPKSDIEIVTEFESLPKDEQTNMMNMARTQKLEEVETGAILPNGKPEKVPRAIGLKYPEIAKKYDEYLEAKQRLIESGEYNDIEPASEKELEDGQIQKTAEELEADFEEELKKSKRGNWVKHNLAKVKVALFAFGAFGSAFLGSLVSHGGTPAVAKTVADGEGVYNEFTASGLTEKTRNFGNDEKLEDDFGQTENKEDEDTNEKISSTAKFKIGGKEFVKESEKYKGGYKEHLDPYYDDDKHSEASMGGPAYDGEWKGTPKQVFESYESTLAGIKGSAEASGSIGMVIGAPGAENIKSKSMVNKFSNELRNGPSKEYDKYANGVADEVNNFLDGGRIKVTTIKAGESYTSTYTKKYKSGRLGIKVDEDVTHNYDVHMIDMFNKDGKSLFNNPEAKEKICELLGLPSDGNYIFGLALECGGNQITAVEVDEPEIEDYLESEPEITADLESVPELDDDLEIIPDKPDKPEKPEEPDEPEPDKPNDDTTTEEVTPEPTPVTVVTIPELPSDPDSTPTTITFTPTSEEETLTPKGPDEHGGNAANVGTTEDNNPDVNVNASDDNKVNNNEAPGSSVGGDNSGTNTEAVNPGGLNQPEEPTVPENQASANSRQENANMADTSQEETADRFHNAS